MQRLWGLIRTEFLREFESPVSLVFFLILPLVFTAAVSSGLSSMDAGNAPPEEVRIPLYVVQADEGPIVDALFETLASLNFDLEITEALPEDEFGLEIPADFSARLLSGETTTLTLHTRPDSTESPAVEQSVMAAQGRVGGAALVARSGLDQARDAGIVATPEEEDVFFADLLSDTLAAAEQPPAVAEVHWPEDVRLAESRATTTSAEHASAGQIVTWVQITLLGAAEVLVSERLGGTLKRLLVSPASRETILGGKLLARLTLGLAQIAILLVGGQVLFGVRWGRDPLAVALVSVAFALATVGLGMLLATVVKTRGQASSAVIGLAMAMSALGGAWYPLEITPKLYRQVVQVLPSNWAMRAYNAMLAQGATMTDVLPYVGVLLGFAALFITLGVVRFRKYE